MHYLQELKRIIEINSFTANAKGVNEVGTYFDAWLKELGYNVKLHKRTTIGHHHHYVSHHTQGEKLLLVGHLDTVFPPSSFEHFREDEQWVYGPGVCDMKGGNIVMLEALRHLHATQKRIENIDVLLVSDEESGSDDSKALTASLASEYRYALVYEAAGKEGRIVKSRKGVGTFTIDITGKAMHAGNHYAEGIDANLEASYKLQKLVALTNLEENTTVNVGKISGGIGANTISPCANLLFEIRYSKISERDRLLNAINTIVADSDVEGTTATLQGGIQRDVMSDSAEKQKWVSALEHIAGEALLQEGRGGVSDANILSANGVLTLDGFGPYGDGDHTEHERALKESFGQRIDLSSKLLSYFNEYKQWGEKKIAV